MVSLLEVAKDSNPTCIQAAARTPFPGIFRGALGCRARLINEEMKLAAANAIASIVNLRDLQLGYIIPSVFDNGVATAVATAVMKAARESCVVSHPSVMG